MPPTPNGSIDKPPPTWQHYLKVSIDLPSASSIGWPREPLPLPEQTAVTTIPTELIDDDPIRWIEQHFYIPETRGPITLDDYQQQVLRAALERDADGRFRYSTIVYSDIKKSAKSTIAAGVTLWRAFQVDAADGWGSIYIIANDLKQADSRVFYYLRRAIQLNPALRRLCTVRVGSYKVTLPNATFIEAVPIDPSGEAGSNADMVVFSELWGAHSKAQAQMWTEMTLPPTKFGQSFRWVETYAGVKGEAPILEQLYDAAVSSGRRLDDDLEIYDNPGARLFCLWNTRPRLSWQSVAYYNQERAALLPTEFDRVHRNTWSDGGADAFLPSMALWDACRDDDLPPLSPYEPCVLALDGAESDDTFASIIVSKHPTDARRLAVRYVRIYVPIPGIVLDDSIIERDIRDVCARYAVQELAYDRALIGQLIRRLTKPKETDEDAAPIVVPCVPFNQGADRLIADKGLYDLIGARSVAWSSATDGIAELRQHIANANKKIDTHRHLRIVKRTHSLKIDGAVCLSMSAARAAVLTPRTLTPGENFLADWRG
jgi:phage terminase large subunit-like protein